MNGRDERIFSAQKGYDARLVSLGALILLLLLVLAAGLAHRQLGLSEAYSERERLQNQRRVLVPAPRGNLLDRDGRLLAGNRPRLAVTISLDDLRAEIRAAYLGIRRAYRDTGDRNLPTAAQMLRIARVTVVNRHLAEVNRVTGREDALDPDDLDRNFRQNLLLPYVLVDGLDEAEFARLLERIPPNSPLQLHTSSMRIYPGGPLAAHVIGYVSGDDAIGVPPGFPGNGLATFRMRGAAGREGLEKALDARLRGGAGGAIYRVDPAGYRINPPLKTLAPRQGDTIRTSLDADLQLAAERALEKTGNLNGAVVAVDVSNGEILALATRPGYDLNTFIPRLSREAAADINARGAWLNRATSGLYPPGSAFKLVVAIAGLRSGDIDPDEPVNCPGYHQVAGRRFACHDGHAHGDITLATAIEKSCNVYFYKKGLEIGVAKIAAEARRFGLDRRAGLEIAETGAMLVPDPAWKLRRFGAQWYPGDTANLAIGQGFLQVTPLQMALLMAGFARDETTTRPTLLRPPGGNPPQHGAPTGLTPEQRAVLVNALEQVTLTGTGRILQSRFLKIPGLRVAGKTGTAQRQTPEGTVNFAWFICYAPVENPRIALAVMIEGDTPGEETGGGRYAAPVAQAVLKAWREKNAPAAAPLTPAPESSAPPR
ncbi:MAG: peptidoglycan glycosyltransferase [Opitutaceae bacterium]|jgi:penicillin-binding protein 2|nr:peptidoglycan glycosyltransferase [Opitutaceae bacterium]